MTGKEKRMGKVAECIGLAVLLMVGVVGLSGCEDLTDDESDVQVTNWDNHDYIVRLYRASDNSLVGEKAIDEGESRDFDDVDEGDYYLTITRVGETAISDRSSTFTVEDEQDVAFAIDGNGNIN